MGKNLIIKGADFSANAVDVIEPPTTELVTKTSGFGLFFLKYTDGTRIQQETSANQVAHNTKIVVADVSEYAGRTVRITSANYVIAGADYDCFCASLGDISFNDIPNMSYSRNTVKHAISAIETFNVTTTTTGEVATVSKVVPQGANYLVVTARFDEGLTDQELSVRLVV